MIPRGRPVITPAEIAERAGVPLRTWRRRDAPAFQQRVPNLFKGRYQLYDLEQTTAYLDGKPVPALPAGEHPDDLLNDREAADILRVSPATVRTYREQGYLPTGRHPVDADGQEITSITVIPRRAVERRRASLPADHKPGQVGRPTGSAAHQEAADLYSQGQASKDTEIAEALGVSRSTGYRALRAAGRPTRDQVKRERQAKVKALMDEHGEALTLRQIAEEVGVSTTTAHRLVQAVRTEQEVQG